MNKEEFQKYIDKGFELFMNDIKNQHLENSDADFYFIPIENNSNLIGNAMVVEKHKEEGEYRKILFSKKYILKENAIKIKTPLIIEGYYNGVGLPVNEIRLQL